MEVESGAGGNGSCGGQEGACCGGAVGPVSRGCPDDEQKSVDDRWEVLGDVRQQGRGGLVLSAVG